MQMENVTGARALEAALARVSHLPLPITGVPGTSEHAYTDIPPYDDQYSDSDQEGVQSFLLADSYSDDPYVDCPYNDYSDNKPDSDD